MRRRATVIATLGLAGLLGWIAGLAGWTCAGASIVTGSAVAIMLVAGLARSPFHVRWLAVTLMLGTALLHLRTTIECGCRLAP